MLPNAGELQRVVERIQAAGVPTEPAPDGLLLRDPSNINLMLTDHLLSVR
jgi:hypothetical protein